MTEDDPIVAGTDSFGSFMSDVQRFDLQEGEDCRIRLSPEAMNALDDEFGNTPQPSSEESNSPQISEEE